MVYTEKDKARYKKYCLRHPERLKAKWKRYYEKNKERDNSRCRKYHWNNRDKIKIRKDAYNKIHGDIINFGGLRDFILTRDNHCCVCCGMSSITHKLIWGVDITIDHIDGNRKNNSFENLQTLCLKCHGHKDGIRNGLKIEVCN